jgi:hypothetical protein
MKTYFNTIAKGVAVCALLVVGSAYQTKTAEQTTVGNSKKTVYVEPKGEVRILEGDHGRLRVTLSNPSTKNSCEVYTVSLLKEKWLSPSLMPGKSLSFGLSKNNAVLIKNFSAEKLALVLETE